MTRARSFAHVATAMAVLHMASASPVAAQVKAPTVLNPDPAVRGVLAGESAAIQRLLAMATNRAAPAGERVKAVGGLGGLYFDHFLANAEGLIQDPSAEVAQASVLQLGGQIAMLHTSHGGGHAAHAAGTPDAYEAHVVGEAVRLLRLAMEHPDALVRNEAVAILAGRGDLQALARIQAKIEAGTMTAPEGVRYMSLAPLDVAAPYIAVYLSSSDAAARRAAAAPLAYHPRYTTAVRSLVVGPDRDETVVRAALPGLSVTDREFASYGSALAQNKALSKETREVALESAVRFALKSDTPAATAREIEAALSSTAEELQSDRARAAVRDLKTKQPPD